MMFRVAIGAIAVLMLPASPVSRAQPEPSTTSMPVFVPHPSDWSPDYSLFPYTLWQSRVTQEQIAAERESCQWFNAQYDQLMAQSFGFQRFLGDHHDDWSVAGMRETARVVAGNLDQSAAFLAPRAHTLFIVNYPDQSEYTPLFHGDSIYRLWYQLTQISDKITRELPSGQINANTATANVYGRAIRDSGVCAGA
jgi:hypothetical protein